MLHPTFSTQKKLPSLRVTLSLLKEIEVYLNQQNSKLIPNPGVSGFGWKMIRISDAEGVEQISSTKDYVRDKFTDSTKSVEIDYRAISTPGSGELSVTVKFVPVRGRAKITVKAEMPDAREAAINVRDGIFRITQHYQTLHWLYGPSGIAAIPLIAVGWLGSLVAFNFSYPMHFRGMAGAVVSFSWLWVVLGTIFRPYLDFECAANKRADDIWKWVVAAILSISGGLLAYGFKSILGV